MAYASNPQATAKVGSQQPSSTIGSIRGGIRDAQSNVYAERKWLSKSVPAIHLTIEGYMQEIIAGVAVSAVVQLFVFLRWVHRRMRDDEINRAFRCGYW
jgi:hypothetical protein